MQTLNYHPKFCILASSLVIKMLVAHGTHFHGTNLPELGNSMGHAGGNGETSAAESCKGSWEIKQILLKGNIQLSQVWSEQILTAKEIPCYLWDMIVGHTSLEMILKQEDLCNHPCM